MFRKNFSRIKISIEGNIGCGKSTLLEYFSRFKAVKTVSEPIEKWCNLKGYNALGLLYEDPKKWGFSFNYYAYLTRLQALSTETNVPVLMVERSLYSTRHVFIENSYRKGNLTNLEVNILDEWYNYLILENKNKLDLLVYLQASPEVCYERIKQRNRKEESSISFEFIKELHCLHEDWLINKKFGICPPVLKLDATLSKHDMENVYVEQKEEILHGYSN